MTTRYGLNVEITEHDPEKLPQIREALMAEWKFEGVTGFEVQNNYAKAKYWMIAAHGVDEVDGEVAPEDFLENLSHKIWQAAGGFCHIEFQIEYLEQVPHEEVTRNREDYDNWVNGREAE